MDATNMLLILPSEIISLIGTFIPREMFYSLRHISHDFQKILRLFFTNNGLTMKYRDLILFAAKNGYLELLKYEFKIDPANSLICKMAAEGGHLEILKFARERH